MHWKEEVVRGQTYVTLCQTPPSLKEAFSTLSQIQNTQFNQNCVSHILQKWRPSGALTAALEHIALLPRGGR